MEITNQFYKRLSQTMDEKAWKQVDLIEKATPFFDTYGTKLTKSDLSQYLSGKTVPGTKKSALLAKTLDVNEAWLLGFPEAEKERIPRELKILTPELALKMEEISATLSLDSIFVSEKDLNKYANESGLDFANSVEGLSRYRLGLKSTRYSLIEFAYKIINHGKTIPERDLKTSIVESLSYFMAKQNAKIKPSDIFTDDSLSGSDLPPGAHTPEFKKRIPILGRIAAGEPATAYENVEGYELVEDAHIDYGLRVKGDSMMNARIADGDTVYVTRETDYQNGDIVIAVVNGDDATVKRYYRYGDEIILRPENPSMKELRYRADEVELRGKVVEVKIKL